MQIYGDFIKMNEIFIRTAQILGEDGFQKLQNASVAVFGIGGVGSHCAEALARSGVGTLFLIDSDVVAPSNINRQSIALISTIGRRKTDVIKEKIADINPDCKVILCDSFVLPDNMEEVFAHFPGKLDYIIDAIDTVSGKLALIEQAKGSNTPVISSMGAGNKLDPTAFEVADIAKTSVCPLARVMRRELKKRGIEQLKVVYSKEEPLPTLLKDKDSGKPIPGSVAFVPSVVGLIIAGEVIKDLSK